MQGEQCLCFRNIHLCKYKLWNELTKLYRSFATTNNTRREEDRVCFQLTLQPRTYHLFFTNSPCTNPRATRVLAFGQPRSWSRSHDPIMFFCHTTRGYETSGNTRLYGDRIHKHTWTSIFTHSFVSSLLRNTWKPASFFFFFNCSDQAFMVFASLEFTRFLAFFSLFFLRKRLITVENLLQSHGLILLALHLMNYFSYLQTHIWALNAPEAFLYHKTKPMLINRLFLT